MNQTISGAIAIIFALIIWGINKKRKAFNSFIFKSEIITSAVLPVKEQKKVNLITKSETNEFKPPTNSKQKISLINKLNKLINSNPKERLKAIEISEKWNDSAVIPILRRGLKDSDRRVVIRAAKCIQKYKSHSLKKNKNQKVSKPLNVFLMR